MCQLVSEDFETGREPSEDLTVAIPDDHMLAVPEHVSDIVSVVHDGDDGCAFFCDEVPAKCLPEEPETLQYRGECLLHGGVGTRRAVFGPHELETRRRSLF